MNRLSDVRSERARLSAMEEQINAALAELKEDGTAARTWANPTCSRSGGPAAAFDEQAESSAWKAYPLQRYSA